MDHQIINRDRGEVAALVLCPAPAAIVADEEPELGAEEEQVRADGVLLDYMCPSAHAALTCDNRLPRLPIVSRLEDVRSHVAVHVAIDSSIRRAFIVTAGFHPGDPRVLSRVGNIPDYVCPALARISRDLDVAIIGANPDKLSILRRLRDRIDS